MPDDSRFPFDAPAPAEKWAQTSIDLACQMLCCLYDGRGPNRNKAKMIAALLSNEIGVEPEIKQDKDSTNFLAAEHSFRRGYTHGFAAALDRMETATQQANTFFNETLMPWRNGDSSTGHIPPTVSEDSDNCNVT